ncbi:oxygenase MpaB family protein [Mycobacterium sp. BMJ-28]
MTSTTPAGGETTENGALQRALPLGPSSLLWKYGADSRLQFLRGYTGLMQNMLPGIGAALVDHSKFFTDPFGRLSRSTPQVIGSIYADDDTLSKQIRDYHVDIKGVDSRGHQYHALNPDIYWWAHATFIERVIRTQEIFGIPFTDEEKDQLIREGATWWSRFGMSDRPVITSYPEFVDYWNRMLDNELENNATTRFATQTVRTKRIPAPGSMPEWVWSLVWRPLIGFTIWTTTGVLDPRCRKLLELQWSERDERRFIRFAAVVRAVHPRLPLRMRYMHPSAYPAA